MSHATQIDRRAVLAGGAAAGTAVALGAGKAMAVTPNVASEDAELLELGRQWVEARAEWDRALEVEHAAEDHVSGVGRAHPFPEVPERFKDPLGTGQFTDRDGVRRTTITPEEAERHCQCIWGGDGSRQRWFRETAAECERVKAIHRQAEIDAGLDEAEEAEDQAVGRVSEIEQAILAAPAATLAGAAVKARVIKTLENCMIEDEGQNLADVVLALAERVAP